MTKAIKIRKGFYIYNGYIIANRQLNGQTHWAIFEDAPEGSEASMYHITNFATKRECVRHIDALTSWARQPVVIGLTY